MESDAIQDSFKEQKTSNVNMNRGLQGIRLSNILELQINWALNGTKAPLSALAKLKSCLSGLSALLLHLDWSVPLNYLLEP